MTVTATNERMVFSVTSERNPQRAYRVDLTANAGAGECSCKDWATRRGPALRNGGEAWTAATMCKHVRAAGRTFLRDLLKAMADSETE